MDRVTAVWDWVCFILSHWWFIDHLIILFILLYIMNNTEGKQGKEDEVCFFQEVC